ncbi:hypothetical protein IAQ61_003979 [Plenodomus lingam]|nr:hypothetical protein IAQ61_003979 [Plenodomus lingam]
MGFSSDHRPSESLFSTSETSERRTASGGRTRDNQTSSATRRISVPHRAPPTKYTDTVERDKSAQYEQFFQDTPASRRRMSASPNTCEGAVSTLTAQRLRSERDSFARRFEANNKNRICCAVDRAAVLTVYNEALEMVAEWEVQQTKTQAAFAPSSSFLGRNEAERYRALIHEVKTKSKVILGIVDAGPDHSVFSNSLLLNPLEPQYATPRIDMHDDSKQYYATRRLNAWRTEGWPHKYPVAAITLESNNNRRASAGHERYNTGNSANNWTVEDWGGEVDADMEF